MTERVAPAQGEASSHLTSGVIKHAAQTDWIVPSGTDILANFAGLSGTPLNGYAESHSASSLDLTVDTGEGFVGGRWAAKDTTTTVTLASSTNNQTVYLGWSASTADDVIIGIDSAFSAGDPGTDRRLAIYECDTDGSGVTNVDTLYNTEAIVPRADDAQTLDGVDSSEFAQLSQDESVGGLWTFTSKVILDDPNPGLALDVQGANEVDSDVVRIVGDADAGQDDDLLSIYGLQDPGTSSPTSSDSVFVTKGEGLVGINQYSPETALDVNGNGLFRGDVEVRDNQLLITRGGQQLALRETDTSTDWVLEGQSDDFRISEQGVDEWFRIDGAQNNRCEMPGGAASQFMTLDVRSSEPPITQNGTMAVQDGSGWDPAGTGELDLVVLLGGEWELCSESG